MAKKKSPREPDLTPEKIRTAHHNRLILEKSPYLLQHAYNPVNWYPWGNEAFERARREDKPVFLSIGYSTCHWCHVMETESFSDEAIAAFLNAHYVAIKVDREERPDVDAAYMRAAMAMRGGGGSGFPERSSCSQTITVVDTTPPVFTLCPANKNVEYTGVWVFDEPIAVDGCGTNQLTVLDLPETK